MKNSRISFASRLAERVFLVALFLVIGTGICRAVIIPTWAVSLDAVFDNREGNERFTRAETYISACLQAELGLQFSASDRIAAGGVYYQPIGYGFKGRRLYPTLYYRHDGAAKGSPWSFSMGMFPRSELYQELPGYLWSDSTSYTQKNIRGLLIQYGNPRNFADLYLDWRGLQAKDQREAFNIVLSGRWYPSKKLPLFVGGYAMMNHFAKQFNAPVDQYIVDHFVVNPEIGVDLSHKTVLDSLNFRVGPLLTLERYRKDNKWKAPLGGWLEAVAEWRWLGLKNTFYAGGRQMPEYETFRHQLYDGEPFFQARVYNRTDVYAHVLRNRFMDLRVSLDFQMADNSFIFYQRVLLSINLPAHNKIGTFRRRKTPDVL